MKTLKEINEAVLSSRAKTAVWPSQNSVYDPAHTKTPYHKDLKKHGYEYTHSVKQNQFLTIHHYANDDGHKVRVSTRTHIEHKMQADEAYPRRNDAKGKEY